MNVSIGAVTGRVSKSSLVILGTAAALTLLFLFSVPCRAQTESSEKAAEPKPGEAYKILYLTNPTQQTDLTDIQANMRNMLPRAKIYGATSQNAICIRATPEDIQTAQRILSELDRPRKVYRLTYTITDLEGGKRGNSRQYSLVVIQGEKADIVQGIKVPIVTAAYQTDGKESTTIQYIDIGLHIDATIDGVRLRTRVEQSSIAEEKSASVTQDPIIRQTVLNGTAILPQGKPLVLGSLDIPGATRRQEVEVAAETVP